MTIGNDNRFTARTETFGALARPGLRALLENQDGGAGGGGAGGGGAGGGGAGGAGGAPDPRDAALAAANAKLAAFEKAEADRKALEAKAAADELERQKKAGETGKVIETLTTQLNETRKAHEDLNKKLADLEPLAAAGRERAAADAKRLEEAAARLPPDKKAIVDGAPSNMKEQLITAFGGFTAPPVPPNGGGGTPPKDGVLDFQKAFDSGEKTWNEAKQRDPDGATRWLQGAFRQHQPAGAQTPLAFLHRPTPPTPKA